MFNDKRIADLTERLTRLEVDYKLLSIRCSELKHAANVIEMKRTCFVYHPVSNVVALLLEHMGLTLEETAVNEKKLTLQRTLKS